MLLTKLPLLLKKLNIFTKWSQSLEWLDFFPRPLEWESYYILQLFILYYVTPPGDYLLQFYSVGNIAWILPYDFDNQLVSSYPPIPLSYALNKVKISSFIYNITPLHKPLRSLFQLIIPKNFTQSLCYRCIHLNTLLLTNN